MIGNQPRAFTPQVPFMPIRNISIFIYKISDLLVTSDGIQYIIHPKDTINTVLSNPKSSKYLIPMNILPTK